jgi:hypothetical protein
MSHSATIDFKEFSATTCGSARHERDMKSSILRKKGGQIAASTPILA